MTVEFTCAAYSIYEKSIIINFRTTMHPVPEGSNLILYRCQNMVRVCIERRSNNFFIKIALISSIYIAEKEH